MTVDANSGNPTLLPLAEAGDVDGVGRLLRLAAWGEELGTKQVVEEARGLAARVSEGRFYLACIGQFKRGKSTLINALVGEPILPVGFIPVTAVPTVIRYGALKKASRWPLPTSSSTFPKNTTRKTPRE